jgi:hypothetical protein
MPSPLRTLLESFLSSVLISVPLSFVLTVYNAGITESFWGTYLPNTAIAVAVATVLTPFMVPLANRLTERAAGPERTASR